MKDFLNRMPKNIAVAVFFVLLLMTGVFVFRDYGLNWDEDFQRSYGRVAYDYVRSNDKALLQYRERYYGPAFELLLAGAQDALGLTDLRQIYFMRHLFTFFIFSLGVYFFYRLCEFRFGSWMAGLLGSVFLVVSPRIFAHAFYNSKDIPFLAFFIIGVYSLVKYLEKKTFLRIFLHALACALLIDIRIAGIFLPAFTIACLAGDAWREGEPKRKILYHAIFYMIALWCLVVVFWPTLWQSPWHNFLQAIDDMKQFKRMGYADILLYFGDYVQVKQIPWHYIPVWIAISTPLLYLGCFFAGLYDLIRSLRSTADNLKQKFDVLCLAWLFLPWLAAVFSGAVLYDEWRHFFFVYPAFLIISLRGLLFAAGLIKGLDQKYVKTSRAVFVAGLILHFAVIIQFMIRYHPYQNVYFNALAGSMSQAKNNFELDYWGLSYRKALEYVLANDPRPKIKLFAGYAAQVNSQLFSLEQRRRLAFIDDPKEADYLISNYRWHPEEYTEYGKPYYAIEVRGVKIMVVYKLRI